MHLVTAGMTVADFCAAIEDGSIRVNRDYQRSDKVWPDAARSFLIETILVDLPVPKLFMHQITDVRTRLTIKEVVDGQQRSKAIKDFYDNSLRLSRTLALRDAAGKTYDELPDELKAAFLDYQLDIDLFTGASPDDVREVFRRINSYTVPLNPEEQRHASRQGPFKWFIHQLASDYDEALFRMGVFNQSQLVRMQDAKLLTEICHALLTGITTTSKTTLDELYRKNDIEFPEEQEFGRSIRGALDQLIQLSNFHETALMKPHVIYTLALALIYSRAPVPALHGDAADLPHLGSDSANVSLGLLTEALEAQDERGPYGDFVRASSSKTNVAAQRRTRFRWLLAAVESGGS